ncbi:MAG: MATE family efflux transporter [Dehalococcoidales bacterium]|nr:MAG: MATE family efflux transporter [Dehalococcoidales bacterium]
MEANEENLETEAYGGRRGAFARDWTKGSILKNLLSLGWPMSVSAVLMMMGPTIDLIWVGRLGEASLAGVGVAGTAVMVVNSARMGLTTGTRAMVARFVGGRDIEGANHVAQQAFVISTVFSTSLAIIGIALAEPIMRAFGLEEAVVAEGAAYMRVMFIGSVAMSFRMMGEGIMQASGDAMTPMLASVAFRVIHVALCPFLVLGWWIFPRMGVTGAALTNVISQGLGATVGFWALFSGRSVGFDRARWRQSARDSNLGTVGQTFGLLAIWRLFRMGPSRLRMSLRGFSLDRSMIWRIVRIGIPASVTGIERSFANVLLVGFVSPFGTTAVTAHTLIQRVGMFFHMPGMGLGQAAGVLAGQNLGARQPERAERTGWIAVGLFSVLMVVASAIVFVWAEDIIGIFSSDPATRALGGDFLRIEIVSFMFFGLVQVLVQCLNGVGDTLVPMVTTLLTMWLVQVPMAYFIPKYTPIGVYGVRWGVVTAIVLRAITYAIYFKAGRWKRKRV